MEMEMEVKDELAIAVERLAAAADALELAAEKIAGVQVSGMQVTAATDQVAELEQRLRVAEATISSLRASCALVETGRAQVFETGRKTLPAGVVSLLAKHGEGESIDRAGLDTALVGLSMEQRIAVKSQLLRAGLVS